MGKYVALVISKSVPCFCLTRFGHRLWDVMEVTVFIFCWILLLAIHLIALYLSEYYASEGPSMFMGLQAGLLMFECILLK